MSMYMLYKVVCYLLIATCILEMVLGVLTAIYKKKHFENVEKQNEILKHQNKVMYSVLFTERKEKEDAENDT